MSNTIEPVAVAPTLLASVRRRVARSRIRASIIPLFDIVYGFLRANDIPHLGINVCVYRDPTKSDIELEAGVQVRAPFTGSGEVRCSPAPAGDALRAIHMGDYSGLGGAYDAVFNAAKELGIAASGPSWEVYGHWNDDPALRRTDVYLLLAGSS